ncbi:MAG: DUF423 domain-containing protein [Sphingomonadales bacterium]|nr:DUF423 domain-containing protein [Sphingomonadales bacterium]
MPRNVNIWIVLSGLNGFIAVAAAAIGAHILVQHLSPEALDLFRMGAIFHLVHALALIAVGVLGRLAEPARFKIVNLCGMGFQLGIIFFSGSIYWLALFGAGSLGPLHFVTPIGGGCLLVGWAAMSYAGWTVTDDYQRRN